MALAEKQPRVEEQTKRAGRAPQRMRVQQSGKCMARGVIVGTKYVDIELHKRKKRMMLRGSGL
jgi:hypothetical protein